MADPIDDRKIADAVNELRVIAIQYGHTQQLRERISRVVVNLVKPQNNGLRQGRDTPCVGVCNTLYVDICQGCGRTAQEEANWVVLSEEEKDAVWDRLIKSGWKPNKGIQK